MKLSVYKVHNNPYEAFLPKILNLNQIKPFKLKCVQSETICIKLEKQVNYTIKCVWLPTYVLTIFKHALK